MSAKNINTKEKTENARVVEEFKSNAVKQFYNEVGIKNFAHEELSGLHDKLGICL